MLGFLSGYLFIYFVVKYFGPETQGRLSLSFSVMILSSLACRLGIDTHFVKVFALQDNLNNARGIYFKLLPYLMLATLVLSTVIFFAADLISLKVFKDPELTPFLQWTAPCVMLFSFVLLHAAIFRGLRMNSLYAFLFNGGRFLFSLIFFFVLLMAFEPDEAIVAAIAHTGAVLTLVVISLVYLRRTVFPVVKESMYRTKSFVKQSLPMLLSASLIVFLGWADSVILGIFKDSAEVGIYSVLIKVAAVVSFAMQATDSILAPKIATAFGNGEMGLFKRMVRFTVLVNSVVALGLFLGILLFKGFILGLFGDEFIPFAWALIILAAGQLINAILGPVSAMFQMTGHQVYWQNILFIAFIVNVILNLSLVQSHGIYGVATATAVSVVLSKLIGAYYIRKKVWQP
ncbi:oligosaccharide flippase family protein [Gilvibacter sediminis]|uniref:oligosaccharide flippase family protein n=1 Tax=Gilvibacter sediminis TaxID=379071 RepID=UPI002350C7DC|nr:oligosaccharide flippase family protein [Gilvibacter sediminis]MDC7996792.1 oligosaccharide flippase family protein [Gilvibacter sediminis]